MTIEGANKSRKDYGGQYAGMADKILTQRGHFAGMAGNLVGNTQPSYNLATKGVNMLRKIQLTRITHYNNDYSLVLAELLSHNWKAARELQNDPLEIQ